VRIAQLLSDTWEAKFPGRKRPCVDTVAAAALAHDLGHPPFGHVAEHELNRLLKSACIGDTDGYEGNAQSFRILTRLAVHREAQRGLYLSRRVLAATLKYPWLIANATPQYKAKHKFGAYEDDAAAFAWVTGSRGVAKRSIEAAIMDVADSITYSVHDLTDFYRAGLIDVGSIAGEEHFDPTLAQATQTVLNVFVGWEPYVDSRKGRARVARAVSTLITIFINNVEATYSEEAGWICEVKEGYEEARAYLQDLTLKYVINSDSVAATQVGHRRVVRRLFRMFLEAAVGGDHRIFPAFFRSSAEELKESILTRPKDAKAMMHNVHHGLIGSAKSYRKLTSKGRVLQRQAGRLAADCVASLTDSRALALYARVTGMQPIDLMFGRQQ